MVARVFTVLALLTSILTIVAATGSQRPVSWACRLRVHRQSLLPGYIFQASCDDNGSCQGLNPDAFCALETRETTYVDPSTSHQMVRFDSYCACGYWTDESEFDIIDSDPPDCEGTFQEFRDLSNNTSTYNVRCDAGTCTTECEPYHDFGPGPSGSHLACTCVP